MRSPMRGEPKLLACSRNKSGLRLMTIGGE
jgi:hypothetical protein